MNIRIKTFLVIAAGFLFIILLFIGYASFFIESQFRTLEEEHVSQVSEDLYHRVSTDLQNMNRILLGYSGWNDTYQYVQDPHEDYTDTNYKQDYLQSNGISGIIIFNRTGDLLFNMVQEPDSDRITSLSPAQINTIANISSKYHLISTMKGVQGIISLGDYDALIASQPVLTDSYEGPAQGTLHYITWLDSLYLKKIMDSVDRPVQEARIADPQLKRTQDDYLIKPDNYPVITISPQNLSIIDGSFIIPGLSSPDEYQFIISLDRSIYASGLKAIGTNIFFLILSGFVIGVIILRFVDKALLSRIEAISKKIRESWNSHSYPPLDQKLFLTDGNDELDILYQAIDPVFARIASAQLELKQSENFFRKVADTIRDGLLIFTISSDMQKLEYYNPQSLEILGGSCTYTDIRSLLSYAVPEDLSRVLSEWEAITSSHSSHGTIEFWIHTYSGYRRYVVFRFSFIESGSSVSRIIVVINDLTERKMAEESLKESEEKYRFMTENVSDVHWQMTPDLTFTYVSPSDEQLRGYPADEVIGKKIWEFIPLYAQNKFKTFTAERYSLHKSGTRLDASTFEVELFCKDGSTRWIEIVSNPIYHYDGKLIGFHGVYRNVTDRKIAQDAIDLANKKLSLLASITRHDVLNQMTVIMSTLELMKEEEVNPFVRSMIEAEDEAAGNVTRLIQFARDYQDIGLYAPQWFQVQDLINRALLSISPSDISITIHVPLLSIFADALLENVFLNLIDNSMRHGVSVTAITIEGWRGDDGFHLIFSDDGQGISPDEHDMIFVRGHGKNTGMGLFLIREILSITGISIEENGVPGKGARFEMIIPEGRYRIQPDD